LDEKALRRVDAILVENPWMQTYCQQATEGLGARVLYAPPGVNTETFRPLTRNEAKTRRPYLLAVGRMSDVRKNPMLLLEAYARLVRGNAGAPELVLAGSAPPDHRFWDRARALGLEDRIRLVLAPSPESLARLFREALCLIMSSDEEGFGVVVIEAMSSGVPVVSTRCGGPDGIIADGVDGYLVNRNDAETMAERVGRLVADPSAAREMGARARATVEARYSDKVAGDVYLDLYDDLLGR